MMLLFRYVRYVAENVYYNNWYKQTYGGDLSLFHACSWESFKLNLKREEEENSGYKGK